MFVADDCEKSPPPPRARTLGPRVPGGQEVVVLPPLLHPLLHSRSLLSPPHQSLRRCVLQEGGGLQPPRPEEAAGGGEEGRGGAGRGLHVRRQGLGGRAHLRPDWDRQDPGESA